MLFSVSARKSSSKWLDRLRSSKGFPSVGDLNLEQFLTHQNPNLPSSSQPKPITTSADDLRLIPGPNQPENQPGLVSEAQNQNEDKQLFNAMSNVLAELFVIGESSNVQAKKMARKQLNPRICTNDHSIEETALGKIEREASSISDGISPLEVKEKELNDQVKEIDDKQNLSGGDEEEEKGDSSLSGFSRTEVTVIDTSSVSWKFEKVLFRKKNVWKVREKRSKTTNFAKKQKASSVAEDVGKEKKQKVSDGQCSSSNEGNRRECALPLVIEEACHQNERSDEVARRTVNNISEVAKKKHSDLKLGNGSSSVILIKSIPPSKKNGASTSRSCMKPVLKRHKA